LISTPTAVRRYLLQLPQPTTRIQHKNLHTAMAEHGTADTTPAKQKHYHSSGLYVTL
jgi:hypothetical protein